MPGITPWHGPAPQTWLSVDELLVCVVAPELVVAMVAPPLVVVVVAAVDEAGKVLNTSKKLFVGVFPPTFWKTSKKLSIA